MKAFQRWKVLFIILGGLVMVASLNIIVRHLTPVRLDTTEGDVYTLSEGTREILRKTRESERPVTIRLYVSGEEVQLPKELREYAKRVEDLLEEYAKVSGNALVVQSYEPVPNSVAEDAAILDGIPPRDPLMDGEEPETWDDYDVNRSPGSRQPYFFGLSVSSLENIEAIPFLDPEQEENLEYEITRAIAAVTRKEKLKIGLLEGNEIGMAGQPAMMGGRGAPPWIIYRYLEKDFDIVSVPFDVQPMEPGDTDHVFHDLDLLMIVHPVQVNRPQSPQPGMPPMGATTLDGLSEESQYAIDQFVLRGGKVLAFLDNQYMVSRYSDPYSTVLPFQRREDNPQWLKDLFNLFDSEGLPHYHSGLDKLYKSWGVRVGGPDSQDSVIFDPKYTTPVAYQRYIQQMLQGEFRLVNQLRSIPDQRWTQAVVQSLEKCAALGAEFENEALDDEHPVTRNLSKILMIDPSPIEGKPASGLRMKTFVHTSPEAKAVPADVAGYSLGVARTLEEGMDRLQQYRAKESRHPVAVVLEGTFKSAFDSDPTKEPEPAEVTPPEPVAPPAEPPVRPPLLPRDAPDSVPAAPETEPAPEPGPEPDPPAQPEAEPGTSSETEPAPEPAPDTTPDPEPESGSEEDPQDTTSGEPAEGEFPNPQNPDAEAETQPEAPEPASPDPPAEETPALESALQEPAAEPETAAPDAAGEEAAGEETSGDEAAAEEEEVDHHLVAGTEPGTVAIVSDVDLLFNFFMGDPNFPQARRDNENLAFVLNLIESLIGDQDLINVRGRGSTDRPFNVINDIRKEAAEKQASRSAEIDRQIEEANKALMEGQMVITQEGVQVQMDAERAEELRMAQAEIRQLEQERRLINREQREEIQAEISKYKWANMLATPILVIVIGFLVGLIRKVKTAAK